MHVTLMLALALVALMSSQSQAAWFSARFALGNNLRFTRPVAQICPPRDATAIHLPDGGPATALSVFKHQWLRSEFNVATQDLIPKLEPARPKPALADGKALLLLPLAMASIGFVLFLLIDACIVWWKVRRNMRWARKSTSRF